LRSLTHIVLLGMALAMPAHAQDLDAKTDASSQRWQTYQERLQSTDPIIRSEALGAALREENTAIRNGALWYALRSRQTLAISLIVPPGSSYDPGSIPILEVTQVEWDKDRSTIRGRNQSQRVAGIVRGELIEGKLHVTYATLGVSPDFADSDNASSLRKAHVQRRRCSVILALAPSRDALEGSLQCEGMSRIFPARLPLG
jgi:hypothetical protein